MRYDELEKIIEDKGFYFKHQKEKAPVQSKPIGRIDYLHTDGRVRESIEYTSPYQLEKDIKEENYYGVPMKLDHQPQGVEIIDSPYLKSSLDIAKATC